VQTSLLPCLSPQANSARNCNEGQIIIIVNFPDFTFIIKFAFKAAAVKGSKTLNFVPVSC